MNDDIDLTDPDVRETNGLSREPQDGPGNLDDILLPEDDFDSFEDPDAVTPATDTRPPEDRSDDDESRTVDVPVWPAESSDDEEDNDA